MHRRGIKDMLGKLTVQVTGLSDLPGVMTDPVDMGTGILILEF